MTKLLFFDFQVNKVENQLNIKREFDAHVSLVWEAWTNPEILDQWWAPKPYRAKTKSMDFRVGGTWLYCMIGPEGDIHWCRADYTEIEPQKYYKGLDAFCNEQGELHPDFPRTKWSVSFSQQGDKTLVSINNQFEQLSDLEKIIELGFKEGFTAALENLDQYLASRHRLWNEQNKQTGPRVCTYLNFPGNTEEAFLFYQKAFKTDFIGGIQRFGDLPADENQPPVNELVKKMILHIELPITANHVLMGTDAPKDMGFEVKVGNNMHISLEPDSKDEATRLFEFLSAGGQVSMPLQDMFWGAYFGSFTDRFGINWMVNFKNS